MSVVVMSARRAKPRTKKRKWGERMSGPQVKTHLADADLWWRGAKPLYRGEPFPDGRWIWVYGRPSEESGVGWMYALVTWTLDGAKGPCEVVEYLANPIHWVSGVVEPNKVGMLILKDGVAVFNSMEVNCERGAIDGDSCKEKPQK